MNSPQDHHPGYPPPGYPPQQKKGKGPVIAVVIVAVVLLLGGLGTGGPRPTGSFEQKTGDSTLTGMRTLTVKTEKTSDYGEKAFELRLQSAKSSTALGKL